MHDECVDYFYLIVTQLKKNNPQIKEKSPELSGLKGQGLVCFIEAGRLTPFKASCRQGLIVLTGEAER